MSDWQNDIRDRNDIRSITQFICNAEDVLMQVSYIQNVLRAARCYGRHILSIDAPFADGQNNISLELDDEAFEDINRAFERYRSRLGREVETLADWLRPFTNGERDEYRKRELAARHKEREALC